MQTNYLETFVKYIEDWNTTRAEYSNWKCKIPIIGVFFSMRVINKLSRITKEYEQYLSTNRY
jgi:hypothetical protein